MQKPKICVVGSSNYDLITYADRLPKQGETILGNDFKMSFGGKGANQAVAAAKLGADVYIVTKLGDDIFGQQTLENFKHLNMNTNFVSVTNKAPSGVAPIWVDKHGHNSIIVVPGANYLMTFDEIDLAKSAITSSQIVICQNEIPFEITTKALKMAKENGVTTLFNPAPFCELTQDFLSYVDILCLNEIEGEELTKHPIHNTHDAFEAGKILVRRGIKKVLITLGENGCVIITQDVYKHILPFKVKVVDTTGAGDCFIGSFAYFFASGLTDEEALYRAQFVASCSVQKTGTQTSYPNAFELPSKLFDFTESFNYEI